MASVLESVDWAAVRDAFAPSAQYMCYWATSFFALWAAVGNRLTFDDKNRIISILHAIVAVALCLVERVQEPALNVGAPSTPFQHMILEISLGYFVYDFIACSIHGEDFAMTFHHIVTNLGLAFGVWLRQSGSELTACLFMMEVTNPMLHLRTMLRAHGMKDTPVYQLNEKVFFITFFFARMVVGSYLCYVTGMSDKSHIAVKIGGFGIYFISMFWFIKMLQTAARKVAAAKRPRGEGAPASRKKGE